MSTEVTTEMMNEVIGVFCGNKVHMKGDEKWLLNDSLLGWPVTDLRYHESWTWLMPVVEKCQQISKEKQKEYYENNTQSLDDPFGWRSWAYRRVRLSTNINKVHAEVYQFITWYNDNQQKQTNETTGAL